MQSSKISLLVLLTILEVLSVVLYLPVVRGERNLNRGFFRPQSQNSQVQRVVRKRRLLRKRLKSEEIVGRTVKNGTVEKQARLFSNPFGILGHSTCVSSFPDGRGEVEGACYNEVECVVKGGRYVIFRLRLVK